MAQNIADYPSSDQSPEYNNNEHKETLFSWLVSLGVSGVKSFPSIAAMTAIQIGIVLFFQFVFWWEGISQYIPKFIKSPVIFLTATYNNIIPKTLYWIIIFTFGKKLFFRIRKKGFVKAMSPILSLAPELKKAYKAVEKKAYSLLLMSGGIGLIIANNFASYSRFSGARNKMDKYFVAIVISFTISYLLGEGKKHWIFKFSRLSIADICRLFKLNNRYTDHHTYIIMSSFVLGLLADAPLILMKLKYGGYILGAVCFAAGIILSFVLKNGREKT